ncbi:urease accessory protein UreD [Tautonia plasticadhaerens]|uniref:Urease accessory protein UreH n=1 Tax=Tautonia plasticadhaerens TaxID=2527974 RepID=A0A518GVM9_9BACT|nr:urease accessory protein UreD [Tautonia plasticadhaerens]QDV32608.1 Urease accessory protein UreH [Tautonia plasticadhaerens]
MPPFDLGGEPAALLYLINLTAGLLDGDGHLIELVSRAGTRAVVTGQAASRVHPAVGSFSTQQWAVEVEDDAVLVVLPGPTIPYRGSRYYQRGRVDLSPTGRILWGDIWLAGRYERGAASERFVFDRIVQDLEFRRSGLLLYRDRFRWDGPWTPDAVEWHLGDALATGSLYASGPPPASLPEPAPGLRRAAFPLDDAGFCVRWCGPPALVTEDLVRTTLSLAAEWTSGPGSPPWLLRSSGLAPNHWFSAPPARP